MTRRADVDTETRKQQAGPEVLPATHERESASALTPLDMLGRAVSIGADVEVLERLMALNERWQADHARRSFTAALSALRAELPPIVKTREVDFTTAKGGRTHYRYEDLAEITDSLSPVMAKHGLSFRWRTDSTQKGLVSVTCIVEHRDGHAEETTLAGPYDESGNKNPIQAIGSVVTYLQRYTLKAAIGVAAAHDDEGRSAGAPIDSGPRRPEPRSAPLPGKRQEPKRNDGESAGSGDITEGQQKLLWGKMFGRCGAEGIDDREAVAGILHEILRQHGFEHVGDVTRDKVDDIIESIDTWEPGDAAE